MMLADLMDVLLWSTLVSSFAILLVLALRSSILNRFGARVTYLLWSIVPIVLIASMLPASEQAATMQRFVLDAEPVLLMPAISAEAVSTLTTFDVPPLLLLIWVSGCAIFAIAMIVQQRRFIGALGALDERDSGIHYAVNALFSPVLIGLFQSRIVVPSDFDALYDETERELILRHERIHRDRGDHWLNALAAAFRCVFWFNPLIHVAAAVFRQDQELACDALVVAANPKARRAYASAMLKAGLQAAPLPVGCQWQSAHPLKERVLMLQKIEVGSGRRRAGNVIFALMAASASFAAWALQPATATQRIEVEVRLSGEGGKEKTLRKAVVDADEILRVEVGEDERKKVLDISFRPFSPNVIQASGEIREGDKIVASPQVRFKEGEPATIYQEEGGTASSESSKLWQIDLTARLVRADSGKNVGKSGTARGGSPALGVYDEAPQYARISAPVYPADTSGARLDGTVYLNVRVGRDGRPVEVKRIEGESESQVSDALADAAITAVRTWTFDPAVRDGEKVEAEVVVPITFGIHESPSTRSIPSGVGNVLDAINVSEP